VITVGVLPDAVASDRRRAASFEEFVVASSPHLRRLAFAWCRDWHEADDLVQHTLEKMYRSWHRVRAEDPFAYARTTLLRTLLAERRRARHRREVLVTGVPDRPGQAEETSDAVMDALIDLPPRQRAVVLLRIVEDLSVAETARVLGVSPGTVKSQMHDAMTHLRARVTQPTTHKRLHTPGRTS